MQAAHTHFVCVVASCLLLSGAAQAQSQPASPPNPGGEAPASSADVLERLKRLEQENQSLAERVGELERHDETQEAEASESGGGLTAHWGDLQLTLQLFGDYGFSYENPRSDGTAPASFQFGSVDFFFCGKIGESFRMLSETLIEAEQDAVTLDEERLYGAYDFNDALYAKLGLEHLPTCRWNRIYHHGKWLQLTIERPFMARFEDDGGILAAHYSGLELGGRQHTGAGMVEYAAIVSNGRGPVPTDRQRGADNHDSKAVDVELAWSPSWLEGLTVGANARDDLIPPNPGDPARARSEHEFEEGFFGQFERGPFSAIAEAAFLQHDDRTSNKTFNHRTHYVQVGWRHGEWTPYARADWRLMAHGDPYYAPSGLDTDEWEATLGIRWDFVSQAAIKFEGRYGGVENDLSGGATRRVHVTTLAMQLSWYF
jgi:hypothetical protein